MSRSDTPWVMDRRRRTKPVPGETRVRGPVFIAGERLATPMPDTVRAELGRMAATWDDVPFDVVALERHHGGLALMFYAITPCVCAHTGPCDCGRG